MTPASQLQSLIAAGLIADARALCERQQFAGVGSAYYNYWLSRLSASTDAASSRLAPVQPQEWQSLYKAFEGLEYKLPSPPQTDEDTEGQIARIKAKLPFKGDIYMPTERIPQSEQLKGLQRVEGLVSKANKDVSQQRFELLKESIKKRGKRRIFVIGNGPSLKKTDLQLLKNEITIGFNGIFLHPDFVPTIYIVEDHLVAEDRATEIHEYECPIKIFPSYLGYTVSPQANTIFLNHIPRISYPVDSDFSDDVANHSYTGGTVTYTGLQVAASLGFEEIILVGVDASYRVHNVDRSSSYGTGVLTSKSDDVNHFDSRYFGSGYRWHDPNVNVMLQAYRKARDFCQQAGIRLVNATIGGCLEVFPRVDYYRLFPGNIAYPKCAIIDFTSIEKLSATGMVKKNLFAKWHKSSLLHVHSDKKDSICAFQSVANDQYPVVANEESPLPALRALIEFSPDVLYLRPTLDRMQLTAMQVLAPLLLNKPYVIHYMDDWLKKASIDLKDETAAAHFDIAARLFEGSSHTLSIGRKMSEMLVERFQLETKNVSAVHNFIQDSLSTRPARSTSSATRRISYFGGIEPDMGLDTLLEISRQVDVMNREKRLPYRLEFKIVTSKYSISRHGARFAQFGDTHLEQQLPEESAYRDALADSDLNLICYNFDPASIAYVRYSVANKLPDLISAKVPFLVVGHADVGTIGLLRDANYPFVIDCKNFSLQEMLDNVFNGSEQVISTYKEAIENLLTEFSEVNNQTRFHQIIRTAACDSSYSWREIRSALPSLARLLDSSECASACINDARCVMALLGMERELIDKVLRSVREHGISWSVKSMHGQLNKAVKTVDDLNMANPKLQIDALAFFICSIGNERYEAVCDIVRQWLLGIQCGKPPAL